MARCVCVQFPHDPGCPWVQAVRNIIPPFMEGRPSMNAVVTRVVIHRWKHFPLHSERCPFELRLGDEVRIYSDGHRRRVRGFSRAGVFLEGLQLAQPWYAVSFVRGG